MKTQDKPFNLDDFLPYKLSIVSQSVSQLIAPEYERKFGLSMSQWRVLVIICNSPPLSANEICDKTRFDKMTVSRAVKALRVRELVGSTLAKSDGRKRLLSPTNLGHQIYNNVLPIALSYEKTLLSALSDSEKKGLETTLNKLLQKITSL